MKSNTITVNLELTEIGVKRFQFVPTFNTLLHSNQVKGLKAGSNPITVNMTVWGKLQQVAGYDSNNIKVSKL